MRIGVYWKSRLLPQHPGQCDAVHVGQLHRNRHHVETGSGAGIECLAPVRREVQGGADLGQAVAEYGAIQARVVDQQDVHEVFRDLEIAAGTK
jgi:hypothetical protein